MFTRPSGGFTVHVFQLKQGNCWLSLYPETDVEQSECVAAWTFGNPRRENSDIRFFLIRNQEKCNRSPVTIVTLSRAYRPFFLQGVRLLADDAVVCL